MELSGPALYNLATELSGRRLSQSESIPFWLKFQTLINLLGNKFLLPDLLNYSQTSRNRKKKQVIY